MQTSLFEIKNLKKYFFLKNKIIKAVDDVSFEIFENETFSLVGESASGKSTIAKLLCRIIEPTAGEILLNKLPLNSYKNTISQVQMIFQDPYLSLNPMMKIKNIISEPLKINFKLSKKEMLKKVDFLLERVNLVSKLKESYPHELSGGQRQRVAIARALSLNPKLLICDEILSSLDDKNSFNILSFLKELKKKEKISFLFITHDLSIAKHFSERTAVIYNGKIVEIGKTREIFKNPTHEYTNVLFNSSFLK